MNRRLAVWAGALAVAGLVLAGCAGGSSEETAAEETATEETATEETAAEAAGEEAATEEAAEPENPIVCTASFGVMAPLTGGAASIGQEQLNFAKLAVADFNAANPSADYSLVESDTQLDAGQASTQATALIADEGIVGVVGPAGSQEVAAVGPAFAEASMAFVSPSATNPDLTNGDNPTFYRVVPTDAVQGPTDAAFMVEELGADSVVVIQEKTDYGVGIGDSVAASLEEAGVAVEVIAVPEDKKSYDDVISKVGGDVDVVFVTFQIAAKSEQVAQSLVKAGKNAVVFGSDGSFSPDFKTPGSYISAFAPDINQVPAAADVAARFTQEYGEFGTFGPPVYVATQTLLQATQRACEGGNLSRAGVLGEMPNTMIADSILGGDIAFDGAGDVSGARFYIFQIDDSGAPALVK
jgi:branched-chain amino acid transport system substrate-binding protein